MANLKEIRNRINSVSSTKQITNAMKMVSAAKLNKAQDAITAMRPYAEKLTELLHKLSASSDAANSVYAQTREVKNVLIIAISSNRGLAGAFNTNIVKKVRAITANEFTGKQIEIFTLGKKGNDVLKKTTKITKNNNDIYDPLKYDDVAEVAEWIMNRYVNGDYDKVVLVYNKFINAATQEVMTEQFLPISPKKRDQEASNQNQVDYIFEPEKDKIIKELIPKALKIQLYKALRDSVASEHGARMTAMHKATDNATEIKDDLTLQYNKARQAAITNEILEITSGAEALNN